VLPGPIRPNAGSSFAGNEAGLPLLRADRPGRPPVLRPCLLSVGALLGRKRAPALVDRVYFPGGLAALKPGRCLESIRCCHTAVELGWLLRVGLFTPNWDQLRLTRA